MVAKCGNGWSCVTIMQLCLCCLDEAVQLVGLFNGVTKRAISSLVAKLWNDIWVEKENELVVSVDLCCMAIKK